jgi:lipopolysaccharide/colanic/teichoic acid biosynthesis glycosyltransferase
MTEARTTGFYYVGTQAAQISRLVGLYRRGYAFDDIPQAAAELARGAYPRPEVICCEPGFGVEAITGFAAGLGRHPELSRVPFILDAEGMSSADHDQYAGHPLVDDILSIRDHDERTLGRKIRFLHYCKAERSQLDARQEHETSLQAARLYDLLKRCFDFLVALFLLLLLAPLFVLIAIAVKAGSGGPVLYISKRAGKGYRIFDFYKFRTMYPGADRQLVELTPFNQYRNGGRSRFFKMKDDPRITRVGRLLRKSSLDELPQLINVLRGDMSLVGNRPLPLYEAETLTTDLLAKRFLAPAGITGLWQIRKRGGTEMNEEERIGLDIDYADRSNFLYDLWIMANTANVMIQKVNA